LQYITAFMSVIQIKKRDFSQMENISLWERILLMFSFPLLVKMLYNQFWSDAKNDRTVFARDVKKVHQDMLNAHLRLMNQYKTHVKK
jgi:hypothetical protein